MRLPGWCCLALTFDRGGEIPSTGTEQIPVRLARRWPLVLADLLVVSVVSMVALAPSPRDAVRHH
jgi:hypothetical protein